MAIDFGCFEQIIQDEPLCRYLTHKSQFSILNNRVKASVFTPPGSLELSIFRIIGLKENEIWGIGENNMPEKILYGRAEITPVNINEVGLKIDPNNIPLRHANIIGWPNNDDKSARLLIATELASKASLKLKK